jgi:hypothetical protein
VRVLDGAAQPRQDARDLCMRHAGALGRAPCARRLADRAAALLSSKVRESAGGGGGSVDPEREARLTLEKHRLDEACGRRTRCGNRPTKPAAGVCGGGRVDALGADALREMPRGSHTRGRTAAFLESAQPEGGS